MSETKEFVEFHFPNHDLTSGYFTFFEIGQKLVSAVEEFKNGHFVFYRINDESYKVMYDSNTIENIIDENEDASKLLVPIMNFDNFKSAIINNSSFYRNYKNEWKLIGHSHWGYPNNLSDIDFLILFYREIFIYFACCMTNIPFSILGTEIFWPYHKPEETHLYIGYCGDLL